MKKPFPERISRKTVYSSDWLDLNVDRVRFPSGKIIEEYHSFNIKFESVVVILLNKDGDICLIKSPRYVTQSMELELPSGGVMPGESYIDAASREVLEETGYVMKNGKHVYSFHPSNAISDNLTHIIIAYIDDSNDQVEFDADEVSEVLWLSQSQIQDYIKNQKIRDGFALTSILYYYSLLRKE